MLDLTKIHKLHDKAYNYGQRPREQASDDLVFFWVTQWDNNLFDSNLQYRGQFDVLRKAVRQIVADLRSNPVSIDFSPKAESRDDGADFIDGLYRTDERRNTSIEAYDNAMLESVVAGVGAWYLYTDYEEGLTGKSDKQVIRRAPIFEACNTVYWDPNAKLMDKSDAKYVSILRPYSEDGYHELVEMLQGESEEDDEDDDDYEGNEERKTNIVDFATPESSNRFSWVNGERQYYVSEFYCRDKTRDAIITLTDPVGDTIQILRSSVKDVIDDLLDEGYNVESERVIERPRVTKYIVSGDEILHHAEIAGGNIPVVPVYGERAFVEGTEVYEGIVRIAKDPQRLRNFQMSYLADIVSRSPRPKPIFTADQIAGFEFMYEDAGADNNFPYLLQNRLTENGTQLPFGPVGAMPETPIPTALAASIQLSREAIEDVANPGLPQDIADPDLSGKAVQALQNRIDMQSMVYQQNMKHAKRRDAEIYAAMASVVYDSPRKVMLTQPDGSQVQADAMSVIVDKETGKPVTLNDITNMEFDVYADISPSYSSKREQTLEQLNGMIQAIPPGDPLRNVLMLKSLKLMNGIDFDDVREYANKQLILLGIKEPETEEEMAILQQAQANKQNQQDPNMLLGQAEMMKAQADLMREQRENMKAGAEIQNMQAQTQIDVFEAQTDRQKAQVDAAKAGAELNLKQQEAFAKRVDSVSKLRGSASGMMIQ